MAQAERSYHHGNLRSALLEAALESVELSGAEALSFRELARMANVSPRAPYHHFRDKGQLLTVLAQQGFGSLSSQLETACGAGVDPINCLYRLVEAYLAFARGSPNLYALLFIPEVRRPENLELVEPNAMACFLRLQAAMAAVDPDGAAETIHERALTVWSLLHGLVSLLETGPLTRQLSRKDDAELAARSAMKLALA